MKDSWKTKISNNIRKNALKPYIVSVGSDNQPKPICMEAGHAQIVSHKLRESLLMEVIHLSPFINYMRACMYVIDDNSLYLVSAFTQSLL